MMFSIPLKAQENKEYGLYEIRNYTPKEYLASPQNWTVVQDKRGVMYFGNQTFGVLEYDGKNWRVIETEKSKTVRSLALGNQGRIYVGGAEYFGYLAPDSVGNLKYFSLLKYVSKNDLDFVDVWKTYVTPNEEVFFQTSNKVFRWDGSKLDVWKADNTFHFSYYINNTFYVLELGKGLLKLENDQLELVNRGEEFAQDRIYSMLPFNNSVLIVTRKRGMFLWDNNGKLESFPTQLDKFIAENPVYNVIDFKNGFYSVGTLGGGIAIMDKSGNLNKLLSKGSGLIDATVYYQFLDAQGILWLALNNGIAKIDINSPLSFFNDKTGLSGTIQSITRYNEKIYVATNLGVYYLNSKQENQTENDLPVFQKQNEISAECWDLLSLNVDNKEVLLVSSNAGVYEIDNTNVTLINKENATVLYQSVKDPNRVFVGLANGLSSIYRNGNKWNNEKQLKGIENDIRSIAEDNHSLWLGTYNEGVLKAKLTFSNNRIDDVYLLKYNEKAGFVNGAVIVKNIGNELLFATDKGFYKYIQTTTNVNDKKTNFIHVSNFGEEFSDTSRGVHRFKDDAFGNIWMATFKNNNIEIGYLTPVSGKYKWVTNPFKAISKEIIHAIYPEKNGVVWLGGPDGLFRYDNKVKKNFLHSFNSLIRSVVYGEDSLIFGGTFANASRMVMLNAAEDFESVLPYSKNPITFQFSATEYQDESFNRYSYFLEGFDQSWSDWKNESKAVYTNLPEGDYYFRVKAKNIYDQISSEAVYHFSITPPWYRTIYAYIIYILLFIAFIYAVIEFSTRSLKAIIKKQTAEVVKQKEEIELKNKDITDSINYAKKIQEAILPTHELFTSLFRDGFILFKPKDIVSGDFYWLTEKNGMCYVAAADCTGHGVPGAFMSMIGNSLLNEIVNEKAVRKPAHILDALREGIVKSLKQKGREGESKDGMDISFCAIDFETGILQYAGAHNPLYLIRNNEILEYKADKFPIGISYFNDVPFRNNEIRLEKGDIIYIFSDGYADQFGGAEGKKFMRKRFKQLFLDIQNLSMLQQKDRLDNEILNWRGDHEQVDDVLVIGIKYSGQ